jgi:hypothetical protein
VKAIHFRPPVQAWIEFETLADAKACSQHMHGAVFPKKSKVRWCRLTLSNPRLTPDVHGCRVKYLGIRVRFTRI